MKRVEPTFVPSGPRDLLLYVEDEPLNFELTEFRLRRRYDLLWARTDVEAVDLLRQRGSDLHTILMDVQLSSSTLNGLDLCRIIRGLPLADAPDFTKACPRLSCPILVVTAGGGRYSKEMATDAGADALIVKPVDFEVLHEALSSVVFERGARSRNGAPQ